MKINWGRKEDQEKISGLFNIEQTYIEEANVKLCEPRQDVVS